jgi:hypothetical protein
MACLGESKRVVMWWLVESVGLPWLGMARVVVMGWVGTEG